MVTQSPIIVGLDIGTTKVVAVAGIKNAKGLVEVVGFGMSESKGVEHGLVLNIEQCIQSITSAIDNCLRSNSNLEINNVYVGIAGQHVKSMQTRGEHIRSNTMTSISQAEIELMIQDQFRTYLPPGDKIIDVVPQEYIVDMMKGITNPVGYTGSKIIANYHVVTGDSMAIQNMDSCVKRSNLNTADLVLQPLASAAAVITEEELEAGVALVDIGGGTTDLAVFHDGILKHTQVIPFAGVDITNDIRIGLGVLKSQAELLKIKFGSALESQTQENEYITIPGIKGHDPKEISVKLLASIIEARIQEIMECVYEQLESLNLSKKLNAGIILTGGGAHLKDIKLLTEFITKLPVRFGYADEYLAATKASQELRNPIYATCIGLVLKGFDDYESGRYKFRNEMSNKIFKTEPEINSVEHLVETKIEEEEDFLIDESEIEKKDEDRKIEKNMTSKLTNRKFVFSKIFNGVGSGLKKTIIDLFEDEGDEEFH